MRYNVNFTTAFALAKTITKVNVTDFTSINVSLPDDVHTAMILLTFTRAAGSATFTLDYSFQVSPDNGTTWYDYISAISLPTAQAIITGTTVRVGVPMNIIGFTHIRLASVTNNDTANDLTAVNAGISF